MSFFRSLFFCCTSQDDDFYPGTSSNTNKEFLRILPEEDGELEKNTTIVAKKPNKKNKK
jgi:hypothetical protein